MLLNFTVKFRGLFSQKHLLFFLSVGWFILGNKSNFKRVTFPPTYSQSSIAGSFGLVQLWISDGHQNVLSELNLFQKILKRKDSKKIWRIWFKFLWCIVSLDVWIEAAMCKFWGWSFIAWDVKPYFILRSVQTCTCRLAQASMTQINQSLFARHLC